MRESQYLASLDIANTGLAVIIDCGEFDNIHPFDKQTVGYRLALQALKKVYGANIEADAPVFCRAEEQGSVLHLHFDNAQTGLEFHGDINASFEVAAAQGGYYPAWAEINGDTVVVSSDNVQQPKRARYAWYKYGPTPLYAKNGLAAMPFRTNRDEPVDC
jgi:sialate O-acetylesterase